MNLNYSIKSEENSKLISDLLPTPGESVKVLTQEEINSSSYPISNRNFRGFYLVPMDQDFVYLNFVSEKTLFLDDNLNKFIDNSFSFFTFPEDIPEELAPPPVIEGSIFRIADGSDPSNANFYIFKNGEAMPIPNKKTLDFMLFERGLNQESIRVVEDSEVGSLKVGSPSPDKSDMWKPEMESLSNSERFAQLSQTSNSAASLLASSQEAAGAQIEALNKKSEAAEAQANAEKAKAQEAAEKSKEEQAKALAEQKKAQQEQAKASLEKALAEAQKAEAEAEKQRLEIARLEIESQNPK